MPTGATGDQTIILILAGGAATRFNGASKPRQMLAGERLIDRVVNRAKPWGFPVMIAGPTDFETGYSTLCDRPDGPAGPAAALWSFSQHPDSDACLTIPADCPFLPPELALPLMASGQTAVATTPQRTHPTIGWWRKADVKRAFASVWQPGEKSPSMHRLAEAAGARHILFESEAAFQNINTPADLAEAHHRLGV